MSTLVVPHGIRLRPAEPDRDFGQLAAWFSILEDWSTSETGLKDYFEKEQARLTHRVAMAGEGRLVGFAWAARDRMQSGLAVFFLYVLPDQRAKGIGGCLYGDLEQSLQAAGIDRLMVNLRDERAADREFAERRGFRERKYTLAMSLDLDSFDDRPYADLVRGLQAQGFRFTSMAELGNSEEAQRRLYDLNQTTGTEVPGNSGQPPWASFEEFQSSVCQAGWFDPAGQMVVIESATGRWVAMSAITRFEDYAYNLHTGVDKRYRGRKLAQAVKVHALRYAREVLRVSTVRTHHTSVNLPILAIDRKFGYVKTGGMYLMEKRLT